MSMRKNISWPKERIDLALKIAAKKKISFSGLLDLSFDLFLKNEGYIEEKKEDEIFEVVREMLADGVTAEEINARLLGRREVA